MPIYIVYMYMPHRQQLIKLNNATIGDCQDGRALIVVVLFKGHDSLQIVDVVDKVFKHKFRHVDSALLLSFLSLILVGIGSFSCLMFEKFYEVITKFIYIYVYT